MSIGMFGETTAAVLLSREKSGSLGEIPLLQLLLMKVFEGDAPVVVGFEREKSETIEYVELASLGLVHDGLQMFLRQDTARLLPFLFVRRKVLDRRVRRMLGR